MGSRRRSIRCRFEVEPADRAEEAEGAGHESPHRGADLARAGAGRPQYARSEWMITGRPRKTQKPTASQAVTWNVLIIDGNARASPAPGERLSAWVRASPQK